MESELLGMYKKTLYANLFFGLLAAAFICLISTNYAFVFVVGLLVGQLNFFINGIFTNLILVKLQHNYLPLYLLSFLMRTSAVATIGFMFFIKYKYYAAAYMLGYTAHFIGVFIYSRSLGLSKERK